MVALNKPQPKVLAILGFVVLSILLAVFVGLFGSNQGDADCQCIKKMDAGWRAASILLVVMLLVLVGFLLIYPGVFVDITSP
jgi:hypothetical protein